MSRISNEATPYLSLHGPTANSRMPCFGGSAVPVRIITRAGCFAHSGVGSTVSEILNFPAADGALMSASEAMSAAAIASSSGDCVFTSVLRRTCSQGSGRRRASPTNAGVPYGVVTSSALGSAAVIATQRSFWEVCRRTRSSRPRMIVRSREPIVISR